jgi:hypothetical protein
LQGVSAELEAPLAPRRAAALAGTFPRTASA